jgi:hypothetical protein
MYILQSLLIMDESKRSASQIPGALTNKFTSCEKISPNWSLQHKNKDLLSDLQWRRDD